MAKSIENKYKCLICDNMKQEFIIRNNAFDVEKSVVRCKNCGLTFIAPPISDTELNNFYANSFDLEYGNPNVGPFKQWLMKVASSIYLNMRVRNRKRLINRNNFSNTRNLLEIGCANGKLLLKMKKNGWNITGIEPATTLINEAKNRFNIEIKYKFINELLRERSGIKFDMIAAFHVLEHMPDPSKALGLLRGLLEKKGRIVAEVPTVPMNLNDFSLDVIEKSFNNIHTYHFNTDTFKKMFEKAGYNIIELERIHIKDSLLLKLFGINANVHNLHISHKETTLKSKIFALIQALELAIVYLFGVDVIKPIKNWESKDWTEPGDFIRIIAENK